VRVRRAVLGSVIVPGISSAIKLERTSKAHEKQISKAKYFSFLAFELAYDNTIYGKLFERGLVCEVRPGNAVLLTGLRSGESDLLVAAGAQVVYRLDDRVDAPSNSRPARRH
jgi:hypothetical protein